MSQSEIEPATTSASHDSLGELSERLKRFARFVLAADYDCFDEATAEDAAQQSVVVLVNDPQFPEGVSLFKWGCGICRNLLRQMMSNKAITGEDVGCDKPDTAESALTGLIRAEIQAAIEDGVRQLEESDREIIVSFHRDNQRIEEIATRLELTCTAVRSRLHRARQKLAKELGFIRKIGG